MVRNVDVKRQRLYGCFTKHYHGGIRGLILLPDKHHKTGLQFAWSKCCVRVWQQQPPWWDQKLYEDLQRRMSDKWPKHYHKPGWNGWKFFWSRLRSSKCPVLIDWDFNGDRMPEFWAVHRPFQTPEKAAREQPLDSLLEYICIDNTNFEGQFDVGVTYLGRPMRRSDSGMLRIVNKLGQMKSVHGARFRLSDQDEAYDILKSIALNAQQRNRSLKSE